MLDRESRRTKNRIRIPWVVVAWWIALMAGPADFPARAQYIPPGSTTPTSEIPDKELIERSYTDARWKAGPLRLGFWIGIRDSSFVSNTSTTGETTEEDFTVTIGAGLRGYLKTGSRLFVSAHALPEYVWWQDLEDKTRWNGRYGVGIFGYFNRLTFELSRRRNEEQRLLSTEIQEFTSTRRDTLRLAFELEIASRLAVFTLGQREELENQESESPIFSLLDREDERLELGLRYRGPGGYWLELAHVERSSDFPIGARNLANSGTAERLGIGLQGSRLEFRVLVADSSLEPETGSQFRGVEETIGSFDVLWRPRSRLELLGYVGGTSVSRCGRSFRTS